MPGFTEANNPAFPISPIAHHESNWGMTMREWYAGMAMQGILSSNDGWTIASAKGGDVADLAFVIADTMLKRAKE